MSEKEVPPASFGNRNAMPLADFMAGVENIDLDRLLAGPNGAALSPVDTALQGALRDVFGTPSGTLVLEWLCDATVRRPMALPLTGAERLAYVDRREGENSVLYLILQSLATAREEQPPPREGL